LREKLNAFVREHRRGTLLGNVLFRRYFANTRWIRNPLGPDERARLDRYDELFQKHADRYDFDWLKIAAQAYQESGFDSSAISRSGAIGLMQLLPSTAADPNVGIPDISDDDSNVHAGVRYMAFLRDRYVAGPHLKPAARFDLTLASYNLGPNRVRRLRNEAARRGLDPDRWFDNVEVVALDRVGREPVRYVANINKYFVAYSLALEDEEAARDRRNSLLGSSDAGP
jgi:membrane-bound lytic murein transglycosylase MltF